MTPVAIGCPTVCLSVRLLICFVFTYILITKHNINSYSAICLK